MEESEEGSIWTYKRTIGDHKVVLKHAVVTTIIHLETVCRVEDIVVNMKPAATIIIVDSLTSPVIGEDEVVTDRSNQRIEAFVFAISECGQEGLSIPRVDWSMIPRFSARIKNEIAFY